MSPARRRRRWAALGAGLTIAVASPTGADDEPIELDCLVEPESTVTLSSSIEGVIEEVKVERGDLVQQGQVVATLQSDVESAAVETARARVEAKAADRTAAIRLEFAERGLTPGLYRVELAPPTAATGADPGPTYRFRVRGSLP